MVENSIRIMIDSFVHKKWEMYLPSYPTLLFSFQSNQSRLTDQKMCIFLHTSASHGVIKWWEEKIQKNIIRSLEEKGDERKQQ